MGEIAEADKCKFKKAVIETTKELYAIRDLAAKKKGPGGTQAAKIIHQEMTKQLDKLDKLDTPLKNDY